MTLRALSGPALLLLFLISCGTPVGNSPATTVATDTVPHYPDERHRPRPRWHDLDPRR